MIFFSVTVSGIPSTETLLTSSLVVCQLNAWLMQTLVKCGWKIGYILRTSGKEADETCSLGLQVIGTTSYGFKIWHLLLHGNRGDGGTDHAASHNFFFFILTAVLCCRYCHSALQDLRVIALVFLPASSPHLSLFLSLPSATQGLLRTEKQVLAAALVT
jgi:hypothetical protein